MPDVEAHQPIHAASERWIDPEIEENSRLRARKIDVLAISAGSCASSVLSRSRRARVDGL
jgi:hypothetical protein